MKFSYAVLAIVLASVSMSQAFAPDAECPSSCSDEKVPVCGSNGVRKEVFDNECLLKKENCKLHPIFRYFVTKMSECESRAAPVAECPSSCSDEKAPVCGSNGVRKEIFDNECLLQKENCKLHPIFRYFVTEMSECESRAAPVAECPSSCSDEKAPVCGSNGVRKEIFDNECLLQKENCKLHPIFRYFVTKMSECESRAAPVAECPSSCSDEKAPVCGSNGVRKEIFDNECLLQKENCKLHPIFRYFVTKMSECESRAAPVAECPSSCSDEKAPVCGSNGVRKEIFDNECLLQKENCKLHPIFRYFVTEMSECESRAAAVAECPSSCSDAKAPVCGSNGVRKEVFDNECLLQKENCKLHPIFRYFVTEMSECESRAAPVAECPSSCSDEKAPVCGSNGVRKEIFDNECLLQKENCKLHPIFRYFVTEMSECESRAAAVAECPSSCSDAKAPVCGSNGVRKEIFDNECLLQKENCKLHPIFRYFVTKMSECESRAAPVAECPSSCSDEKAPVCGSNGVRKEIFDNECLLQKENCKLHPIFRYFVADMSECQH